MANLKEVRNRIASVKNTQQITSAMKMVSASKLRKSQTAIEKMRPYNSKLHEILGYIYNNFNLANLDVPLLKQRATQKVLMVVFSSNRGLCGPFNSTVIKTFEKNRQEILKKQKKTELHIFAIGKKIYQHVKNNNYTLAGHEESLLENPDYESTGMLAETLMEWFKNGTYDRIEIVYNAYKNAATQIMTSEVFLPMHVKETSDKEEKETAQQEEPEYIFEPDKDTIIRDLLPKILKVQLFKIFLDTSAAEHGARMTAMHQATENAKELLHDLELAYNKARQAAITNEIMEITSGANALRGT
ncbi:MAG: ATP synthase F1 subunit gamma [Bacteroidales bacterium]